MIRVKTPLCKLFSNNFEPVSAYDSYLSSFSAESQRCPCCGSSGNCCRHGYYSRFVLWLKDETFKTDTIRILRVKCRSCGHTHAILPDFLVPYRPHSLTLIMDILKSIFLKLRSIRNLCREYPFSRETVREWRRVFVSHMSLYLGALYLSNHTTADFIGHLEGVPIFSDFTSAFFHDFGRSFMQVHKDFTACGRLSLIPKAPCRGLST